MNEGKPDHLWVGHATTRALPHSGLHSGPHGQREVRRWLNGWNVKAYSCPPGIVARRLRGHVLPVGRLGDDLAASGAFSPELPTWSRSIHRSIEIV